MHVGLKGAKLDPICDSVYHAASLYCEETVWSSMDIKVSSSTCLGTEQQASALQRQFADGWSNWTVEAPQPCSIDDSRKALFQALVKVSHRLLEPEILNLPDCARRLSPYNIWLRKSTFVYWLRLLHIWLASHNRCIWWWSHLSPTRLQLCKSSQIPRSMQKSQAKEAKRHHYPPSVKQVDSNDTPKLHAKTKDCNGKCTLDAQTFIADWQN